MDFKRHIRELPSFPEPRARFRDIITPAAKREGVPARWGRAHRQGAAVAAAELVELVALGGRERLWDHEVFSLVRYE